MCGHDLNDDIDYNADDEDRKEVWLDGFPEDPFEQAMDKLYKELKTAEKKKKQTADPKAISK